MPDRLSLLVAVAVLLSPAAADAGFVKLLGAVRSTSGEPVASALVRAEGFAATVRTGASGAFMLKLEVSAAQAGVKLYAEAEGFAAVYREVGLDPARWPVLDGVDFTLQSLAPPPPPLAPVASAVEAAPAEPVPAAPPPPAPSPTTAAQEVRIVRGQPVIVGPAATPTPAPTPPPPLVRRQVAPAGPPLAVTVKGTVRDERRKPIQGAVVRFARFGVEALTDRRGRYSLVLDLPGNLALVGTTMTVTERYHERVKVPVDIRPTQDLELEINVKLPRYRGLVN